MNLNAFIKKYDGKFVEAGGSANALNQCVDLANQYINEVLGFSKILGTNAKDFPKKAGGNYVYYEKSPDRIPETGDLVIWGNGKYGHIGIFVEGNNKSFKSFDENYPTGTPAHIQGHYYKNVIGWLRPLKEESMDELEKCNEKLAWYDKEYPLEQQRLVDEKTKLSKANLKIEELKNKNKNDGMLCETAKKRLRKDHDTNENVLRDKLSVCRKECQRLKETNWKEDFKSAIIKLIKG